MKFNQLPDGDGTPQKRRTEFGSLDEKLAYDARNLLTIARKTYQRSMVTLQDAFNCRRRMDDENENNPVALKRAIAMEILNDPQNAADVNNWRRAEIAAEDPRLQRYRTQYEFLFDPSLKAKCLWIEIKDRLLAKDGKFLKLAEGMVEGGVLFGVDDNGNPLFADGGEEPIMKGMSYSDTRNRVLYQYDGYKMKKEGGQAVPTGYEMFPHTGHNGKSAEIIMFERTMNRPFIQSANDKWCSSWLESGEDPTSSGFALYNPSIEHVEITDYEDNADSAERGVRRLLRVKKES